MNKPITTVLVCAAGLIAALSLLCTAIANTIVGYTCTAQPAATGLLGGIGLLITGNPATLGTLPAGCTPPVLLIRIVCASVVVVLIIGCAAGWAIFNRFRQSDMYFRHQLLYRDGFAKKPEVRKHLSRKALTKRAPQLRPAMSQPTAADVGVQMGRSRDVDVFVSVEDSMVVSAAPRSGKGFRFVISTILDWFGPLVTTSTRNDNLAATYAERQRRGEVTVLDPQGLSGIAAKRRVSPVVGCADPLTADMRARAIMSSSALGRSASNQEWAGVSSGLLASLLHAAALGGGGTAALRTWGANPALTESAIEILNDKGAPGWGQMLEGIVKGDPELLANSWMGVREACKPLLIPQVFDALNPTSDAFDADEFLAGENTLYLIGTGSGAGASGGFLSAVLDDVVESARRKALASTGGRLDPPLGLVLDEIANMFSWPGLPTVLSDGGGIGIFSQVIFQSMSQAITVWSEAEAQTIWNAAIVKVLLGGSTDVRHMQDISNLLGHRKIIDHTRSWSEESTTQSEQRSTVPVLSIDELRRLPTGMAVLAYKNMRPALLDAAGWTKRSDAKQIRSGKRATEQAQLAEFRAQYEKGTSRV
ncbi:type IV secretory system conjugative DNA transfer family protein [Leifsonia sp. NPDC102414]|uniref:type IV secretory system conjugative DNA transfer family protein n=1 Tax=Leifsonia sp. NPDC102414 TaxID=3364124 RepID=UPI00380B9A31